MLKRAYSFGPKSVEFANEATGDMVMFLSSRSSAMLRVRGHLTNESKHAHGHGFDVLPEPMDLFIEGFTPADLRQLAHALIVLADQLA